MMIYAEKCRELGLPEPKEYDTQKSYIIRAAAHGHKVNTRQARYIGIYNLHSIVSSLNKNRPKVSVEHGKTTCPFTNTIPPYEVDIVFMTPQQRSEYNFESSNSKT